MLCPGFLFLNKHILLDHSAARRSCPGRRGRWLAKLGYRSIKLSLQFSALLSLFACPQRPVSQFARACAVPAPAGTWLRQRGQLLSSVCWDSGPVYEHLSVRLRLLPGKYQQVAMKFAPGHMATLATETETQHQTETHRSNHLLRHFENVEPGWLLLSNNCLATYDQCID